MASIVVNGDTSGAVTLSAPAVAGTVTVTLPSASGTMAVSGASPSFTTITTTSDASISGITVGKGGGAVANNTVFGKSAQAATATGDYNTAIGESSLNSNTSGTQNTGIGRATLFTNTSGGYNFAGGLNSMYYNQSGASNTAVGTESMQANTTGGSNVAVGRQALTSNLTASNNTAVGFQAAVTNTTGAQLVAIGHSALVSHTTGINCVAVGYQALQFNTTASNNTAIGYRSLQANTATQNTAIGAEALLANTAVNNVAIGYQAGAGNTSGTGNIFIGQGAGYSTYQATTGNFNILIGATAQNSANGNANEIVIGTNNPTGKGGSTGYINAGGGAMYQGNNTISWTVASDRRLKKNIVDNTEGLDIISQIRVRNFEYRTAEEVTELPASQVIDKQGIQLGVIAQELLEVCGDCVKTESTGVMSVNSDNLTWHMINAIKDLKAELDTVKAELAALKG